MADISKETKASVKSERDGLSKKLDTLSDFINTDDYNEMSENRKQLLVDRHKAMTAYQDALGAQISHFEDLEDRNQHKNKGSDAA